MNPGDRGTGQGIQQRGNLLPLPLGIIKMILIAPRGTAAAKKGVLIVAPMRDPLDKEPTGKKVKRA